MDENLQEANNQLDDSHPTIARLMMADFEAQTRDRYLGAP